MFKWKNELQLKGHQRLQGMHYPMGTLHEECMVHKSTKIQHPKNEQILTLEIIHWELCSCSSIEFEFSGHMHSGTGQVYSEALGF